MYSIFDKKDAFDFHIINFPDLPGNIPIDPAYGTYISLLIRCSRACHNYDKFSSRHSMLQIDFSTRVVLQENFEKSLQIYG